jgi:predicted anti-sigma-YlaC factor YlaD
MRAAWRAACADRQGKPDTVTSAPAPKPPHRRRLRAGLAWLLLALLAGSSSCSIKRMVVNGVANSLASGPDVYSSDDDPELVRDALPFGLKTMESLLAMAPKHRALLLATCRGFTQYAYAFIQLDADLIEPSDYRAARELRERARKLFLRARDYGLRGLELSAQGVGDQLRLQPEAAAARLRARDLPLAYWTAAAWGSAISLGKDRPELVADLPAVKALMDRGLALDERFDAGAIHEALITLEALPKEMGGSSERAREHFERAVELSGGRRASPYVTLAQTVAVQQQDRAEFERLLHKALAVDPDADPTQRLANILMQRKARALLAREDDLFLAPDTTQTEGTP